MAVALTPALTTIRQPVRKLGSVAAEALINLVEGNLSMPHRAQLSTELIVRESCGALKRQ
jgi:LacI family transcriptional regulator